MERVTEYSWYLFNVSSLFIVMRWVIISIAAAPPPSLHRMTHGSPDLAVQSSSRESQDPDPEEFGQEPPITSGVSRMEQPFTGRARMVEAWARRCRLMPIDKETDVQSAARRLLDNPSRGLLVVDGESGDMVGVLQERDLIRALGEHGTQAGRMRVKELVCMRG